MILRVILKNFLSFNNEVEFNMFPNPKRTSLPNHVYKFKKKPHVLKMTAIYGANGAGKSNLFKGIDFLKTLTTNKLFLNRDNIGKYFFILKRNAGKQPIELTIEFTTLSGTPFLYFVRIAKDGIQFESLQISGLGLTPHTNIFTRSERKIQYATNPSKDIRNMIMEWLAQNPFSSLLTINHDMPVLMDPFITQAQQWFEKELTIVNIHSFIPDLIAVFKRKKEMNVFATNLFKNIDLGTDGIKIETEDLDSWIHTHGSSELPIEQLKQMKSGYLFELEGSTNTQIIDIENGTKRISRMLFEQLGVNGFSRDMNIEAQSDGTIRLLVLMPAFYDAIITGKTVLIDEIDHSIHPHLVRALVRYFSLSKTKGQLIFTTHQTCLLNQNFLRTDEVWLIEKKNGQSYMYSLNDFKIHNTISIENGYLEGRYGAIPFIGDLNI